jgi:hypothetical protein
VCQGARPFVVTHLQMGSSSCHPFRRLGALTGAPRAACRDLPQLRPLQSTNTESGSTIWTAAG